MLLPMAELLEHANAENYAIAAPVIQNEAHARYAIECAEKLNAPLILNSPFFGGYDVGLFGRYVAALCEASPLPIALNNDHGASFSEAILYLQSGFSSIMVDRSELPYEQNVAQVKELARVAHAVGVSVEAELGHVGFAAKYDDNTNNIYTEPEDAKRFIADTGVDCLAVSIGTSHGAYKGNFVPHLDFDRLVAIKEATGHAPLVLHGGSGSGDENLRKACQLGINKVNVGNDLFRNACRKIKEADTEGDGAYQLSDLIRNGYQERLAELIDIFGSANKAWVPAYRSKITNHIEITENTIL